MSEKKYIDADAVNERLRQICDNHHTTYGEKYGGRAADFARLTDDIPAADVAEVVRCKDCIYFQDRYVELPDGSKRPYKKGESSVPLSVGINVGSYCTRIDYAIVHGYRHGEPSVDETRLWTEPDDFCSYGERKDEE